MRKRDGRGLDLDGGKTACDFWVTFGTRNLEQQVWTKTLESVPILAG